MSTTSTARLSDGVDMFYTDSGPPAGSLDYTTVVMLHGMGFNGHIFEKLHNIAHEQNIRTVLVNRRGYPGSTKYSAEEMDEMLRDNQLFLDDLSRCLALFLIAFVQANGIPKASDDGTKGGIAILGWSRGCTMAMSLFAYPDKMPDGSYTLLQPYIKDLILYDPPSIVFGFSHPQGYIPFADPDLKTADDMVTAFKAWVISYYDKPPANWNGRVEGLRPYRKRTELTTNTWSDAELKKFYSPEAAMEVDSPLNNPAMDPNMQLMTHNCLYNEQLIRTFFPRVKVSYISCQRSIWICVWGAYELRRIYNEYLRQGKHVRKTRFVMVEHANHFFHFDDPAGFFSAVRQGMQDEDPLLSERSALTSQPIIQSKL